MSEKFKNTAIKAASKKLKFQPEKVLSENLEYAADNMADAYRIGAEEAQIEIIARLRALQVQP